MPKVTLEFTLPEEREEFEQAHKGWEYLHIIEEMDNYLRSKLKYSELTVTQCEIFQEVRDKLWELRRE